MQILYSYFRQTGRLFFGCALCVARCNIIRASCETKKKRLSCWKKYIEESVSFDCILSFLCHFLLLFLSTPSTFPSDVLAERPLYRQIVLLWVVFCVMILWVNGEKHQNLLHFNTSWLASLRTWYHLDF